MQESLNHLVYSKGKEAAKELRLKEAQVQNPCKDEVCAVSWTPGQESRKKGSHQKSPQKRPD